MLSELHLSSSARLTLSVICLILLLAMAATYMVLRHRHATEIGSDAAKTLVADQASPYTDLSAAPFSFAQYRNKIRVVNVWASWSPYSATELPMLNTIADEYAHKNVVVIAVDRKEDRFRAQAYLKTIPDTSHLIFAIDETDTYYRSVGGYAMPETIIYDSAGNIVLHTRGPITADALTKELDTLVH